MLFAMNGFECGGEIVLNIIKYVFLFIKIIFFIIPILLIVMLSIDFLKNVMAKDETEMKKNFNLAFKRLIVCMAIFLINPIVRATINLLDDLGVDYMDCVKIAESEDLSQYKLSNIFPDDSYVPPQVDVNGNSSAIPTEGKKDEGTSGDGDIISDVDGNIFIGDSRFVGMKSAVNSSSDNVTWICESSKGYSWLESTAIPKVEKIVKDNKKYNIVINLGVNDLGNINKYISLFNSMSKDSKYKNCNIIVVSVNPVDEKIEKIHGYTVKNNDIKSFNNKLKNGLNNSIKFCETYSSIISNFDTSDGVHYKDNTYKDIYAGIKSCLANSTSSSNGTDNVSTSLKSEISSYIKKSAASGTWSVYVKNMKKNEVVEINSTTRMNSASVIKLYVLATAYDKVNLGSLKESKISSDAEIMIKNSDNEATNRIISAVGGKSVVNSYISKNGYSSNTQLNRLLGGNYTSSGIDNYTTSKDVASLLEKIYNRKLVSSKYSDTMLRFLKKQNTRTKIPAGVSSGTVANKTGEISNQGVQNDAAIVYTKNADYVIVVMSTTSDNSKAINNIKEISRIVYQYYNK